MYQNCCKKCGSTDLFTKEKGNNIGLYCSDCGAYIKWLSKNELNAFEHSNNLEKKYKYHVSLSGEDWSDGYVELTKKEAEIVVYATDIKNWKDAHLNPYSGDFLIDIDNPEEIK